MAIDFPNSPTNGQIYTSGDKSWIWDGTTWKAYGASLSPTVLKVDSTNTRVGINNQSPAYTLDVNGTVEATQFLQGTDYLTPYTGFRNKIINGSFEVWQRGTSRVYLNAGSFRADRWTANQYQNAAHQQVSVTPVTGMQTRYALRSGSSTTAEAGGGARMWVNTTLESADSIPLRGQTVTLSFWVRFSSATCSSSTGTAYGNWTSSINYYTSTTDASTATTGPSSSTDTTITNGSLPTTWTKYTITGTVPSNANNVGVQFGFAGLGNTASNDAVWYEITQVQLERGSVATPFEQRPFGMELALCQRYYQVIAVGTSKNLGNNVTLTANDTRGTFFLPVAMRIAASLTVTTGFGYYRYYYDATSVDSSSIGSYSSGSETLIPYSSGAIIASGKSSMLVTNNASASVTASAEF